MKIIFLGTNGWYDSPAGNTICTLIETRDSYIILDAGSGLYKIDRYIRRKKPIYLFLSHVHLDHVIGFHVLARFNFSETINIFLPGKIKKYVERLVCFPYTASLDDLKTPTRARVLNRRVKFPFSLDFGLLYHSAPCYGFRFGMEGKVLSYCSDTGVCPEAVRLASGADLFITECSSREKNVGGWPHLSPGEAAAMAKKAGVKRLILTHFNPDVYGKRGDRTEAVNRARRIFGRTEAARDNSIVIL